ncbi:MAG TPA: hypothetical protein VFU31_22125 [Candidatus Binatia bacterium]|nr:hypothetical protein [Candidatus Binatia bacterium]
MTITIEVSRPFLVRPFFFRTNIGMRVGWLWFALGIYRVRLDYLVEHCEWRHM